MGFDTAYEAITDVAEDQRWAFGTGFADPFAGLDTEVPDGIRGDDLAAYCLMLGDDALIMSHRLQQWLTRAPELEEETALANIGLDLLGQARLLFTRAGTADGSGRDEDWYAFSRGPEQYRNLRFVEPPARDFAELVVRLLVFSTFRLALLAQLRTSADPVLAAVAAKGVNEVAYHRDYAAGWVVRLGDGTALSHQRIRDAVATVLPGADELYRDTPLERRLADSGVGVLPSGLRAECDAVLTDVLSRAGVAPVRAAGGAHSGQGRHGSHTDDLAVILDELQSVAREHEGARW